MNIFFKKIFIIFYLNCYLSITAYTATNIKLSEDGKFNLNSENYSFLETQYNINQEDHWTGLPFLKEEALKLGYTLDPPLVFSVQHVEQSQFAQQQEGSLVYKNIKTTDLFNVPGINLNLNPDGTPNILISSEKTEERTTTQGMRAGVWVFPFLQFYGLINQIEGETNTYTTSLTQLDLPSSLLGIAAETALRVIFGDSYKGNGLVETKENVKLDLDGTNFGGGFVIAGGYKKYFFVLDTNYTYTDFDFATDYAKTLVISGRVGYDTTLFDRPFRLWGGFMQQNVSSRVTGKLSALKFEGLTGGLVSSIDPNEEAEFIVEQKLVKSMNFIAGARYTFTPNTALLIEGGYGGENGRKSFLATFELLF